MLMHFLVKMKTEHSSQEEMSIPHHFPVLRKQDPDRLLFEVVAPKGNMDSAERYQNSTSMSAVNSLSQAMHFPKAYKLV